MKTYVDTTPSAELMKVIRSRLILQGASFAEYCRANNLTRPNAAAAITGRWTGPKAAALVATVLKDVGIEDEC